MVIHDIMASDIALLIHVVHPQGHTAGESSSSNQASITEDQHVQLLALLQQVHLLLIRLRFPQLDESSAL
ncbi:hypothetical protein A2U01_0034577, partial [Trifolium medium]|nr:hypothetical protein [Trifolium medium]